MMRFDVIYCHAMPCYAMLCYAMLCYVLLCYAIVLCHAMQCGEVRCDAIQLNFGLATSLSFGHKNERRKKENRGEKERL